MNNEQCLILWNVPPLVDRIKEPISLKQPSAIVGFPGRKLRLWLVAMIQVIVQTRSLNEKQWRIKRIARLDNKRHYNRTILCTSHLNRTSGKEWNKLVLNGHQSGLVAHDERMTKQPISTVQVFHFRDYWSLINVSFIRFTNSSLLETGAVKWFWRRKMDRSASSPSQTRHHNIKNKKPQLFSRVNNMGFVKTMIRMVSNLIFSIIAPAKDKYPLWWTCACQIT